jgi:hypothetical protein
MADTTSVSELSKYLAQGTKELREFVRMNIYDGKPVELDRITRYYIFWKYYRGEHYKELNDSMIAFNYVKAFIDKVNHFLIGEDSITFKVSTYDGDVIDNDVERAIERVVLKTWRKNRLNVLVHEILQMGSVSGDVWVGVNWNTKKGCCDILCFDSRYCFPVFAPGSVNEYESFSVRQPIEKDAGGYTLLVTAYTNEKIVQYKQKGTDMAINKQNIFVIASVGNPLKKIPVIHIKNRPTSDSYYGTSDANDIMKLNKVFNETMQELKTIVDYYTAPVTIVTGAFLKQVKRSVGNVWSGLPPEANVFTLTTDADLSGSLEYLDKLKTGMHEIADVPDTVLGKTQAISGTSAAALKMTYQPLVHQAGLKELTYGTGIAEINDLILAFFEVYGVEDSLYDELEDLDYDNIMVRPVFSYGFPTDRLSLIHISEPTRPCH